MSVIINSKTIFGGVTIGNVKECGYRDAIVSNGLILNLDAGVYSSYSGDGRTWYDISGNNFDATLYGTNSDPDSIPLFINENSGVLEFFRNFALLSGNETLYSSDFTWQLWHYYYDTYDDVSGLVWSEVAFKNFLTAYNDVGASSFARIDTGLSVYESYLSGTTYNGGFDVPLLNRWEFTSIVKCGTTFSWYWGDVLKWQVEIDDWAIVDVNQSISIAAKGDNYYGYAFSEFFSFMKLASLRMYNRALLPCEIKDNYDARKSIFGL
jgi:hypothetical protein